MAEKPDDDQARLRKRFEATVKKMQEEQQKKEIARRFLDDKAFERLMNIRMSNPELYDQMISVIISLVQAQKISGKINERQLISLLERVNPKHEPTIEFKHK